MASTNFVVHILAAVALFVCFYFIAYFRANQNLLVSLFFNASVKKLHDPLALMIKVFEFSDIDYEADVTKYEMQLIDMGLLGKSLSKIDLKAGKIMSAGQKPVVILSCKVLEGINAADLKNDFKKASGIDFELNELS